MSLKRKARNAAGKLLRKARNAARKSLRKTRGLPAGRRAEFLGKLDAFAVPPAVPALPELRAAVAVGERLRTGLAWEWSQIVLEPGSWQRTLREATSPVGVVLVEIVDGAVPGWDDGAIAPVLAWAKDRGSPVVAWVTGGAHDPETASSWIADTRQVFVDTEQAVERWRARWPEAAVDVLHPAAQPRLHNPRTGGAAKRRQVAAAALFHGRTEAEAALAAFDLAKLDVWAADDKAASAAADSPLAKSVVSGRRLDPSSPALSRYRVFAELGAPESTASWPAIEAGSAQTPVLVEASAVSRVPADLRELLIVAEDAESVRLDVAARVWQDELRDREGVRLGRAVHARHTFARRVDAIAGAAGLPVTRPGRTVSAVVPTNRTHELDNVFANIARQAHAADGGVELVLVLHGLDVSVADVEARAKEAGVDAITAVEADSSLTLGACMNLGVDASAGQFIAKMDDDNYYGTHYLTDLVAAFDYTDAGIVGKWAHYVWLRSTGAVVLRAAYAEHRYERLVQGGSLVLQADVARELRFGDHLPRAVDTDILNRAQEAGIKTYSGDRFNYVSVRGTDRHAHTWTIADTALMNRAGQLVFYGDPREHVDI